MATRFEIALWGSTESHLAAAAADALDEIGRLEAQLSLFRPDSDIADLNRRAAIEPVTVEPRLFRLLQRAVELASATGGAFDPMLTPLMRAWGLHGASGRVPEPHALAEARACSGCANLHLDPNAWTVRFDRPGCAIDLGAIGKGWAIDRALDILAEYEIEHAFVHGGTSTSAGIGTQPSGEPWKVAIRSPLEPDAALVAAELAGGSLSVSAPHGKQFEEGGRTYGHVLDPRTGYPTRGSLLAAVTAPSATDSDALSTALLVCGEPLLAAIRTLGARGLVLHGEPSEPALSGSL